MNIFDRNYNAVLARNCINENTKKYDLLCKIEEEYKEFSQEITVGPDMTNMEAEELADLINACCTTLRFCGRDPMRELTKIAEKNENRANNQ